MGAGTVSIPNQPQVGLVKGIDTHVRVFILYIIVDRSISRSIPNQPLDRFHIDRTINIGVGCT